jgi:hypothetical protein
MNNPTINQLISILAVFLLGSIAFLARGETFSFTLVDAETDQEIQEVLEQDVLIQSNLPETVNLVLNVPGEYDSKFRSVVFFLDGKRIQTENFEPYAVFGDLNGNYLPGNFELGTRTLRYALYKKKNGEGRQIINKTIRFHIIATPNSPGPPEFPDFQEFYFDRGTLATINLNSNDEELVFSVDPILGSPLPNFLELDPQTGIISGLVAFGSGTLSFEETYIRATSPEGLFSVFIVEIVSGLGLPESIKSFTLVDARRDVDLQTFDPYQGDDPFNQTWEINLPDWPDRLSIRANINPLYEDYIESVRLTLDSFERVENLPPYSLGGDTEGNYYPFSFEPGSYQLRAYGWTEERARGDGLGFAQCRLVISSDDLFARENASASTSIVDHTLRTPKNGKLFPNPFSRDFFLQFYLVKEGLFEIILFDLGGKVLHRQQWMLEEGAHQLALQPGALTPGVYFVRGFANGELVMVQKVLKE